MYRNAELEEFHNACNAMLNAESFDTKIRKEMYKAYKETEETKANCHNCIYYDEIERKCINNKLIEYKMKHCWKAKGIKLLKKAGLYGQKRNYKTGAY